MKCSFIYHRSFIISLVLCIKVPSFQCYSVSTLFIASLHPRQYDCVAASQVLFLTSYIIEPLSASQPNTPAQHQPCCSLHYVTDIYMGEVGKLSFCNGGVWGGISA